MNIPDGVEDEDLKQLRRVSGAEVRLLLTVLFQQTETTQKSKRSRRAIL